MLNSIQSHCLGKSRGASPLFYHPAIVLARSTRESGEPAHFRELGSVWDGAARMVTRRNAYAHIESRWEPDREDPDQVELSCINVVGGQDAFRRCIQAFANAYSAAR